MIDDRVLKSHHLLFRDRGFFCVPFYLDVVLKRVVNDLANIAEKWLFCFADATLE